MERLEAVDVIYVSLLLVWKKLLEMTADICSAFNI